MKTIEYCTIDKSEWGDGPWQDEPDKRQWLDETTGLPCLIVRHKRGGHLCGYVGVPKDHPYHGKHYDADGIDVDVHGGLTFASACSHGDEASTVCHRVEDGEDDNVWWLGFDTAHLGDLSPGYATFQRGLDDGSSYRDFTYVQRECERLAKQLIGKSTVE